MPTGDYMATTFGYDSYAQHPDTPRNRDLLASAGFSEDISRNVHIKKNAIEIYINPYEMGSLEHDTFKLYLIEQYRKALDDFKKHIKKQIDAIKPTREEVSNMRRRNGGRQRTNSRSHRTQMARSASHSTLRYGSIQPLQEAGDLYYSTGDGTVTTATTSVNPGQIIGIDGSLQIVDEAQDVGSDQITSLYNNFIRTIANHREVPVPERSTVDQRTSDMPEVQRTERGGARLQPPVNSNNSEEDSDIPYF